MESGDFTELDEEEVWVGACSLLALLWSALVAGRMAFPSWGGFHEAAWALEKSAWLTLCACLTLLLGKRSWRVFRARAASDE